VNTVSPGSFATEALKGWAQAVGIDPDDLYAIMAGSTSTSVIPRTCHAPATPRRSGPVIAFAASRRKHVP